MTVELLNCDCMEYMKTLPDKAFDLAEMDIGKAGEYLVCADLILKGLTAYPSEQGLPYDVVLDNGERLLKVQVKTTLQPRRVPQRNKDSYAYIFNIKRNGKGGKKLRKIEDTDIYALVALDSKEVVYITPENMPATLNLRVDALRGTYHDEDGIKTYERVMSLVVDNSRTEIAKMLGKNVSVISRMCQPGYKPHISEARYFSDLKRDKEWFSGL